MGDKTTAKKNTRQQNASVVASHDHPIIGQVTQTISGYVTGTVQFINSVNNTLDTWIGTLRGDNEPNTNLTQANIELLCRLRKTNPKLYEAFVYHGIKVGELSDAQQKKDLIAEFVKNTFEQKPKSSTS